MKDLCYLEFVFYILFLIFYIIVVLCSYYFLIVHIFATFMYIEYIYLSSDNFYCFVQNCVFQMFCWRICAIEKYKLVLHLYCYSKTEGVSPGE